MRDSLTAVPQSGGSESNNTAQRLSFQTLSPILLDWCEPLQGRNVLQLGCGDGELARLLGARGSSRVVALDRSARAVHAAIATPADRDGNVEFVCSDPTDLTAHEDGSWDVVVAALSLDGLGRQSAFQVLQESMRILRVGGRLVFAVVHPSRPFIRTVPQIAWPNAVSVGYGSARDHMLFGRLAPFDDSHLSIPYVHKTLDDYFAMLRDIGVTTIPDVREIVVTDDMIASDRELLAPHRDHPLFLVVRVRKSS